MMKMKCIAKARDRNNQIVGYKLQDKQGSITIVKPEVLKSAIRAKKIEITNLTLTSDNRLIDTTLKTHPLPKPQTAPKTKQISKISEEQKIKLMIEKAKVLGCKMQITEIPTYCDHKCILISKDVDNHILYIPDDVVQLNSTNLNNLTFTQHIQYIQGHIKLIGGHNLKYIKYMFLECQVQSLDLSSFDTSNVIFMDYMFEECQAQSINLSNFDTSNVTDMQSMFYDCHAQSLDLSNFNTSNVTNMYGMFEECKAQYIDLSSFDTNNVTDMSYMFSGCRAQSLDLSSFDTSNVVEIKEMFKNCTSKLTATNQKILNAYNSR